MLRVQPLFESALVSVERIDHSPDVPHVDPDEEISPNYSINVLERGRFAVQHEGRRWSVSTSELFVTFPGRVYKYRHDSDDCAHAPTDVCLAVCFRAPVEQELDGAVRTLQQRVPVIPVNNRRAYLRWRLMTHLADRAPRLTIESVTAELLLGALADNGAPSFKPSQLEWYAGRVEEARRSLDEDYASDYTLSSLAADAGMSPFHFARVFRELTGVPPHRYLVRRRLDAAATLLGAGSSVTDACYNVGFQSLSHFIHTFHRRFGVSPSRFNGGLSRTPS